MIGVSSQRRRQLLDITSFVQQAVEASRVAEAELRLGRWQAVYFVELDGPRRREAWVTCLGG